MAETQATSAKTSVAGQHGLSGYWLKMIAVITMLIDHIAATFLYRILAQMPVWGPVTPQNYHSWYLFYRILRGVGRMSFPIYCFLLVEGFYHTRNRAKYALRLSLFALISEVPFDMAFNQCFFDMSNNNVFITLLIGLLTIWISSRIIVHIKADHFENLGVFVRSSLCVFLLGAVLLAGCGLADLLHTDYGACGVFAIFLMYILYQQPMVGFALMILILGMFSSELEYVAILMLIPMYFYNGTRGKQRKYFFYAFYPAHLLILSLICYAMGLGI